VITERDVVRWNLMAPAERNAEHTREQSLSARAYHTLMVRQDDGSWTQEFGDYSKAVVQRERRDSYPRMKYQILTTFADQASIDRAVIDFRNAQKIGI